MPQAEIRARREARAVKEHEARCHR
jgi:hypothetical protein